MLSNINSYGANVQFVPGKLKLWFLSIVNGHIEHFVLFHIFVLTKASTKTNY